MNDGNQGKLLFLRERSKRPPPRPTRRRSEIVKRPSGEGRLPTATESQWLARALYAVAAMHVLYWMGIAIGVLTFDAEGEVRTGAASLVLADLVVAVFAVLGATELGRQTPEVPVFTRVAAGALIAVACVRLGAAAEASFLRDLAPRERLEIVAVVACLVIGVWIVSHSLRLRVER